ncbi:trypsin-like peptidase domain-containing protein [Povalibacter sp.]|uniref:trypsin-like peptidase domain-containing protein n=1 Tax=Povalibacter sp. TaxID=1962978 RepID=UPI002F3EC4E3
MRRRSLTTASAWPGAPRHALWFTAVLVALAGVALVQPSHATSTLCSTGKQCSSTPVAAVTVPERSLLEFAATLQVSGTIARRDELSSQEYFSFSGVGAIVCTVDGKQRMSTAVLVGGFDIGVTVAHTFEGQDSTTEADNCIYTSSDSLGQIRERIPVSYIRSQWKTEAGASGHAAKDFAVVRLREPSSYAQRTMPMGKFSGSTGPVVMIGFRSDMESDPLKAKSRGTVYDRKVNGVSLASLEGFTHDIDTRGIAAGAPVIDERSGIIIGIHTVATQRTDGATRNTMITMNEWLEQTLLGELQANDKKDANSRL